MNENNAIKCTVNNCKHHSNSNETCMLQSIQIGTHEKNPTKKECTDCNSFEMN